jgi:N-acetylmuramic acid 6-phosphate etherase
MKKRNNTTESQNANSIDIDTKKISEIVRIFNDDSKYIIEGINKSQDDIVAAVEITLDALLSGGRLFYVGAGTSGRLGVLDASECRPTFSVDDEMVQGIIAGGYRALSESIEGAEDDIKDVEKIIKEKNITSRDVVIGISCSGTAPFVLEFLNQSKMRDAKTVFITFNDIEPLDYADKIIRTYVGPEIISGSTRMKSGTATKMILNMISTITMIKLNKTYGNFMVDLNVVNNKLEYRAINIIRSLIGISEKDSREALVKARGKVKVALVMIEVGVSYEDAIDLIDKYEGSLRKILDQYPKDSR